MKLTQDNDSSVHAVSLKENRLLPQLADPKFQSTFGYVRISARAVREALITQKGYVSEQLPGRQATVQTQLAAF